MIEYASLPPMTDGEIAEMRAHYEAGCYPERVGRLLAEVERVHARPVRLEDLKPHEPTDEELQEISLRADTAWAKTLRPLVTIAAELGPTDFPGWVYEAVLAIESYEDLHGEEDSGWLCMAAALKRVPAPVRRAAKTLADYRDRTQTWPEYDRSGIHKPSATEQAGE